MKARAPFIRELKTFCGKAFLTVDLFRFTPEQETASRRGRKRKEKVSAPKQRSLNDKRARRYLAQLINTNFSENDLALHLTYGQQPETKQEAEKLVSNYLRRVSRLRKKLGLPHLKYILITEGGDISKRTGKPTRIHHHLTINGGISRDDLEIMWNRKRVDLKKVHSDPEYRADRIKSQIGYANARGLQPDENGLEAWANYLSKDPKGKKRWSASQNLEKPERVTRDHHYSCASFKKICNEGDIYTREFWEKKYKGYTLAGGPETAVEVSAPDDMNDWRVYAKLRRIKQRR